MKNFVIFVACVAFLCVSVYGFECKRKNCYEWPNCNVSFNETRCRCEAIFNGSDEECPQKPCLSNGFCFGIRLVRNQCMCLPVCKDPPYCPYGYRNCRRWDDCMCEEKNRHFTWSDEDESSSSSSSSSSSKADYSEMILDVSDMDD